MNRLIDLLLCWRQGWLMHSIFFALGIAFVGVLNLPVLSQPAFAQTESIALWQQASFPVENFQVYTSAFGYRTSPTGDGGSQFHYGLDMAAPQGSYVRNW